MLIHLQETDSTSNYIKARTDALPQDTVVVADFQTAGRGQRGNSWESAPGENLLMSMLHFHEAPIHPSRQFMISKAVALAARRLVAELLAEAPECMEEVTVKWPNDIYIGDRKAAGILIENSIASSGAASPTISHSVIGIGLNLNQQVFTSPAPNPVSVSRITGLRYNPIEIANQLGTLLSEYLRLSLADPSRLDSEYLSHLWRSRGFHRYIILKPSPAPSPTAVIIPSNSSSSSADSNRPIPDRIIEAEIIDVAPDGPITMRCPDGSTHTFAFKEISPVI